MNGTQFLRQVPGDGRLAVAQRSPVGNDYVTFDHINELLERAVSTAVTGAMSSLGTSIATIWLIYKGRSREKTLS